MIVNDLAKQWTDSGLCSGDVVLLHSNLKPTLKYYLKKKIKITPENIFESFLEAVGPSGTMVFPLFNFDFTSGVLFNINETPSQMGVLTEIARQHPQGVRTGHPIYSFVAIGNKAKEFKDIDNFSGYGEDSPFAKIREMNGKIAVLGLPDQNSMTYYHYVEEMNNVSYRYHKVFKGEYVNSDKQKTEKEYGLFVRDVEKGVLTDVNSMGELAWHKGLYSGCRYDEGNGLRVVSSQKMYDAVSDVIDKGNAKGMLYKIKGEGNV